MTKLLQLPLPPAPPREDLARCPWRNPSLWATWGGRSIDGIATSFDHLWPFDMELCRPARGDLPGMRVDIRVVFDCHVCTEAYDAGKHSIEDGSASLWLDAGRDIRVFHPHRYELSKQLPELIRGLTVGATRCFGAKRNNYMIWKPQGAGSGGPHYQVFFDLYRTRESKPRLVMYVQSAYLKDRPLRAQRENSIVFATLCAEKMELIGPRKTKAPRSRGSC